MKIEVQDEITIVRLANALATAGLRLVSRDGEAVIEHAEEEPEDETGIFLRPQAN